MKIGMPKHEKNEVKTYKQTVVNAVILVVVLSLFVYALIQLSASFSTKVSTQRTQQFTEVTSVYFDGYIFKDSAPITAANGIVHYLISDGEKVGVGQAYAEIYTAPSMPQEERERTQRRLNELSERIRLLERGIEGGKSASDLGGISDSIGSSYYTYIDSILAGDLMTADKSGDVLLGALVDYSSVTLSEAAKNTLSALRRERADLISSIGGEKTTLISNEAFVFAHSADGYEGIFESSRLDGLTRALLDELAAESAQSTVGTVGSAVYTSKWYLALPADDAEYLTFKDRIGSTYEIELLGSQELSLDMLLENVVFEEDDPERAYLLFSSLDLAKIHGLDRRQSVRVRTGSITGYRIPEGAVQTVGEQTGVYILVGNMIEFRRITVIGKGNGYYIANTYEKELEEDLIDEIPYLGINDLIVTSGNDLYDGKLLD